MFTPSIDQLFRRVSLRAILLDFSILEAGKSKQIVLTGKNASQAGEIFSGK